MHIKSPQVMFKESYQLREVYLYYNKISIKFACLLIKCKSTPISKANMEAGFQHGCVPYLVVPDRNGKYKDEAAVFVGD